MERKFLKVFIFAILSFCLCIGLVGFNNQNSVYADEKMETFEYSNTTLMYTDHFVLSAGKYQPGQGWEIYYNINISVKEEYKDSVEITKVIAHKNGGGDITPSITNNSCTIGGGEKYYYVSSIDVYFNELVKTTINDVLATNTDFPVSTVDIPENSWVNENNGKLYYASNMLCFDANHIVESYIFLIPTTAELDSSENNYTYTDDDRTITFYMDSNKKLDYIECSGSTISELNGTYRVPHVHTEGEEKISFIPWDGGASHNSLPTTAGNYYLLNDITITSTWFVPEGINNLCLNGHVINANGLTNSAISVLEGSTLNLYDCEPTRTHTGDFATLPIGGVITGAKSNTGGGVCVLGTFNMYGGTITGNTSDNYGGGVYVSIGTFNMYGGTITKNSATNYGGGVCASIDGNITISGNSKISYNEASFGAGVCFMGDTLNINGGTIEYNNAKSNGSGIYVTKGVFNMTAGSINNNEGGTAGGIIFKGISFTMTGGTISKNSGKRYGGLNILEGSLMLGGSAKIVDNTAGTEELVPSNLYIKESFTIGTKTGETTEELGNGVIAPTNEFSVGITTGTLPTNDTPVTFTNTGVKDYSAYFFSDNEKYGIYFNDCESESTNDDYLELAVVTYNATTKKQYGNLADAINEAVEGDEIELLVGSNNEDIVLPLGVTLYVGYGYTGNITTNEPGKGICKQNNLGSYRIFVTDVYDIIYKDMGGTDFTGTHEEGYPLTYMEEDITILKSASKEGYIFGGWYTNKDCTGEPVEGFYAYWYDEYKTENELVLYAKWIKTYDLYVENIQVTGANLNDVLGDLDEGSTVIYNPETNTLTLNNANIYSSGEFKEVLIGIENNILNLTIELKGTNVIGRKSDWDNKVDTYLVYEGIKSSRHLNFKSDKDSSLSIYSDQYNIETFNLTFTADFKGSFNGYSNTKSTNSNSSNVRTTGDVLINNGTFYLVSNDYCFKSTRKNITINNATVILDCKEYACVCGEFNVNDSVVTIIGGTKAVSSKANFNGVKAIASENANGSNPVEYSLDNYSKYKYIKTKLLVEFDNEYKWNNGTAITYGDEYVEVAPKTYHKSEEIKGLTYAYTYYETKDEGVTWTKLATIPSNAGSYKVLIEVVSDVYDYSKEYEFTISKKDITSANVVYDNSKVYNGETQTFAVTSVTIDNLTVTYDVTNNTAKDYSSNGYTMTITANGNFTGSITKAFAVTQKDITNATVVYEDKKAYNGETQTFGVTSVTIDNLTVTYNVTNNTAKDYSTNGYSMTITANGNFTGSVTKTFNITQIEVGLNWSTLTVEELVYNGQEKTLTVTLTGLIGEDECNPVVVLSNGKDNVNVGAFTYEVTQLSNNNYKLPENTVSNSYSITKATYDMSGITFIDGTFEYDGTKHSLAINGALPEGVTVTYDSNELINVGEVKVTASFTGSTNYEDIPNMEATIKVTPKPVNEPTATGEYKYSGEPISVKINGVEEFMTTTDSLTQTNPGVYTINYTLDNNYKWAKGSDGVVAWEIKAASISSNNPEDYREDGKQYVIVEMEDGFTSDIIVKLNLTLEDEVEGKLLLVDYYDLEKEFKLSRIEKVGAIFNIKLMQTVDGKTKVIQPSDIDPNATVKVKILIPADIDLSRVTRILHVHNANDIEEIAFDASKVDKDGYYEIEVTRFSEFAFVYEDNCFIHWILIALLVVILGLSIWFYFIKKNELIAFVSLGFGIVSTIVLAILGLCVACLVLTIINLVCFVGLLFYILVKKYGKKANNNNPDNNDNLDKTKADNDNNSSDDVLKQNKKETVKKVKKVSARQANELMSDDKVKEMVSKGKNKTDKTRKVMINIDTISTYFNDGETVNLEELKKRIPSFDKKATYYKICARGSLDKKLIVEADEVSLEAKKMILLTGGEVIISSNK